MNEPDSTPSRDEEAPHAPPPAPPPPRAGRPSHTRQVIETAQSVLTALALAFIFRAFLVEAFIIPTGSMAQSLLGAHATRTCPACGWEYDFVPASDCLCPNCHLRTPLSADEIVAKAGDRILVHKWPMVLGGFLKPQRWDVIVFRNPSDPNENYIKRLVGLPGETIEIVDGDLFIDGRIARKTPAAQSVLWFVVFDQDYFPQRHAPLVGGPRWVPDAPSADPGVGWAGFETRVLHYHGLADQERGIRFAPRIDEQYFEDVYAYDRGPSRPDPPLVGDMRIVAEVTFHGGEGYCRWELTRDGQRFLAETRRDGTVSLTLIPQNAARVVQPVATASLPRFLADRPYLIEFAHLDYRVYLKVDDQTVLSTTEADYGPDLAALRSSVRTAPLALRVAAAALDLDLRGLRVDRDVYYTYRERFTRRAYVGHPLVLERGEYFVLGDNSPDSRDSREWDERGPHLPANYRLGTVIADQIVGSAALVYLPGLWPLDPRGRWRLPDLGRVRFVR